MRSPEIPMEESLVVGPVQEPCRGLTFQDFMEIEDRDFGLWRGVA
jgi:hypothetical protein